MGPFQFTSSLGTYKRYLTREVAVGSLAMGGKNPVRIQSMTTTDTMNTLATVEQTIRMVKSGCEYVRITAPSMKEAENLALIKKELRLRGYDVPLIADIHFTPNAAELAARIVEKVRINPGNYVDKKKFAQIDYSDASYQQELERIRDRFLPLVSICKEYGTAMRIGTNHGSLSDRIMSRYGDTPKGMVESAMEFVRMCTGEGFQNIVISMKSSNPQVMIQAYRLLVHTMEGEGMNFPLHLGVTEAGDGEDGRIKSALGIGTLLEDGIGDTVRVSLTEEPEEEAPVARALVKRYEHLSPTEPDEAGYPFSPFQYARRSTHAVLDLGTGQVPVVCCDLSALSQNDPAVLITAGYHYNAFTDKYRIGELAADYVFFGQHIPSYSLPGQLKTIYTWPAWQFAKQIPGSYLALGADEYLQGRPLGAHFVLASPQECTDELLQILKEDESCVIVLEGGGLQSPFKDFRRIYFKLLELQITNPVVLKKNFKDLVETDLLAAAVDLGSPLIDGFGDGLWTNSLSAAFSILQASRMRVSKTEYISCPSCGRTLFDLMEVTQMIRLRTSHLKGIKIAIMGCIVNGPGEMADADYGYVGAGPGKITLYRSKEVVRKNVDSSFAVNELIDLIKEDGLWVPPPTDILTIE